MVIDAHQHYWTINRGDYGWLTPDNTVLYRDYEPDDLRPLLQQEGVIGTVLIQAAPTLAETRYLLNIADVALEVLGVVGWVDLEAADAPEILHDLVRHGCFKGVRPMLQDLPDPEWILRPSLRPALATLVELDLRLDALVRPAQLPAIRALASRHPDLKIVLDHGGKPPIASRDLQPWTEEIQRLAQAPGVFCKLSGLITEAEVGIGADALAPYVRLLLDVFGPSRTMWGSDWPVLLRSSDYAGWLRLARALVPPEAHAAVFVDTAARFYGLENAAP